MDTLFRRAGLWFHPDKVFANPKYSLQEMCLTVEAGRSILICGTRV